MVWSFYQPCELLDASEYFNNHKMIIPFGNSHTPVSLYLNSTPVTCPYTQDVFSQKDKHYTRAFKVRPTLSRQQPPRGTPAESTRRVGKISESKLHLARPSTSRINSQITSRKILRPIAAGNSAQLLRSSSIFRARPREVGLILKNVPRPISHRIRSCARPRAICSALELSLSLSTACAVFPLGPREQQPCLPFVVFFTPELHTFEDIPWR